MRPDPESPPGARLPSEPPPSPRLPLWALLAATAVLVLFAVLAWQLRLPGPRARNDDAQYILLARSLRSFEYLDWHILGSPYHTQYPPGYPFLLAVISAVFGEHWSLFLLVNLGLCLLTLGLVFDAVRRLWTPTVAVAALGVTALLPAWLYPLGPAINVLADAPYAALTAAGLWVLATKPRATGWMAVTGALAILAALTRSIGVTFLGALFLAWLLERRWKAAAAFAVTSGLIVGAWLTWTVVGGNRVVGRSYVADALFEGNGEAAPSFLGVLARRLLDSSYAYGAHHLPLAFGVPHVAGTPLDNVLGSGLLIALGLVGFWSIWRRWRSLALYLACYGGLLLVWPWAVSRFLVPVLPLIVLAVLLGASWLGERFGRGPATVLGLSVLLIACSSRADLRSIRSFTDICDRRDPTDTCHRPVHEGFMQGLAFIRDSVPADEPVVAAKDATVAYLGGHTVVPAYDVAGDDADLLKTHLQDLGVRYVYLAWVASGDNRRLVEKIRAACRDFEVLRTFRDQAVLLLRRDDGAGADCEEIRDFADHPVGADEG